MAEDRTRPMASAGGLLIFGLKPNRFLPQAGISAAAYSGTKKDYDAKARSMLRGSAVSLFPAPSGDPGQPLYPPLERRDHDGCDHDAGRDQALGQAGLGGHRPSP